MPRYATLCHFMLSHVVLCYDVFCFLNLSTVVLCLFVLRLKEKTFTGHDAFALLFFGSVSVWAWGHGLLLVSIVSKRIPHPRAKAL